MSLIVSRPQFTPAPEGVHRFVCVDVVDLGQEPNPFGGMRDRVKLVFEIEATRNDGRRHVIRQSFTKSLHERATLRSFLERWRRKVFDAQELDAFDLDSLKGKGGKFVIDHKKDEKGRTWANIGSFLPCEPNEVPRPSGQYDPVREREPRDEKVAGFRPAITKRPAHQDLLDAAADLDQQTRDTLAAEDTGGTTPF